MKQFHNTSWLADFYQGEEFLGGVLSYFGIPFAPVYVGGDIGLPGLYNIPDVTPVTTLSVTYKAAGIPVSDTYSGTTLWNLLQTAGGVETTSAKNDILNKYVIATGSDGYTAVYAMGEMDPAFGNQPITIASSDTAGQLGPHGADGLSRVVVPGDIAGGRYVSDLVSLTVDSLPEPGSTGSGGYAASATLAGAVADPMVITPETLSALNQSQKVTATYISGSGSTTDTYTGVSLWNLIQDAGLLADPSVKNDLLHFGVVATGSDGYRALFSLGEIDPQFGNQQDLVAYADQKGQLGPGGSDGALRIVVPGDGAGGRYVSNLTNLQVVDLVHGHVA
ncbi:hypothetical protein [Rhodopila sp.]|uniref:hypothetical protein n=1 Tax=Rhodopila sp. TaxID=2480087 RepID=UPI002D80BA5A|nr:hypothetical protein [Rhodopila sp.]